MFYISFNKLIIYDLLLNGLKLMAVFGQYIEIKIKKPKLKLWKWIRNCLAVFAHFIASFENYIKMKVFKIFKYVCISFLKCNINFNLKIYYGSARPAYRWPYFCKRYHQRKIGTFLWATLYILSYWYYSTFKHSSNHSYTMSSLSPW